MNADATPGRLPEATKKPCNECPWRRDAEPGFLGPHPADEWAAMAHSGGPIACHKTIQVDDDWDQPSVRQCAGAATFRSNSRISGSSAAVAVGPADRDAVFGRSHEFLEHHRASKEGTPEGRRALGLVLVDRLSAVAGMPQAVRAELARWATDLGADRMSQATCEAMEIMFGERLRGVE